jgi:hypothetical protein
MIHQDRHSNNRSDPHENRPNPHQRKYSQEQHRSFKDQRTTPISWPKTEKYEPPPAHQKGHYYKYCDHQPHYRRAINPRGAIEDCPTSCERLPNQDRSQNARANWATP